MIKPLITLCLLVCVIAPPHVYACSEFRNSRPDYKAVLQDWLGCKSKPKQDEIKKFWKDFGFQKSGWDNGQGWENWCDERLPLGKTFAAIKLMRDGWAMRTTSPKNLHALTTGSYDYAKKHISRLEFRCKAEEAGASKGASAYTSWGLFNDTHYLFEIGVNEFIGEVAASLLHEARHTDTGASHIDCTKGSKLKDACDKSLAAGGAWAYSIAYQINYAYHGKEVSGQFRLASCFNANNKISQSINKNENLRCDTNMIDMKLPTPKCPSSRPSGTVLSESSSPQHTVKTYFSSKAKLSSKTSTTCTYSGKVTTKYGTPVSSGTSTQDGSKTYSIYDFNDRPEDILPTYIY